MKLQHTQRNTELNNLIDKLTEASPRDSCFAQWGSSDESRDRGVETNKNGWVLELRIFQPPFALIKQLEIRRLYASTKIIPKKLIVGGKLESWWIPSKDSSQQSKRIVLE